MPHALDNTMKKFSTIALKLTVAPVFAALALLSMTNARAASCEFLPNAPDQHTVMRGDTLWDIAGKFLQHPWCWPQVWGLNRAQIHDPHWIYPGQAVYFYRAAGRLRLGTRTALGGSPNVRLLPGIRTERLDADAVPAIAASVIEPFLSQPLIIEENQLADTPRIVAAQEGRVFLGKGDKAYVRGDLHGGTSFQAFRPGTPLIDPETKAVIGFEAVYLGTLKLQRAAVAENEAHTFTVVTSKEEMGVGDRLLAVPPTPIMNYMPHPPEHPVAARIVAIYGGVTHAGQNQVVSINRGKNDGIDVGTVLELSRHGQLIRDTTDHGKTVKLPDEQYGSLFVFRTFDKIAYGLIMQVTDSVQVGDLARSPE